MLVARSCGSTSSLRSRLGLRIGLDFIAADPVSFNPVPGADFLASSCDRGVCPTFRRFPARDAFSKLTSIFNLASEHKSAFSALRTEPVDGQWPLVSSHIVAHLEWACINASWRKAILTRDASEELLAPSPVEDSRFAPQNRRRLSPPALRTFLAIADLWRLTEKQRRLILGSPSRSTYYSWCRAAREHRTITLDVDVLTRISAVLGIHQALGVLFGSEEEAKAWLGGPHDASPFGGRPPLDLVTSGTLDGLLSARRFLDAVQVGLNMAPNEADADFKPYKDSEIIFL